MTVFPTLNLRYRRAPGPLSEMFCEGCRDPVARGATPIYNVLGVIRVENKQPERGYDGLIGDINAPNAERA